MHAKRTDEFHDDIALRLMEGDETVLPDIFEAYGPPVEKAISLRFKCLTLEDAEEVVADAVFRLWNHRRDYDPDKASVRTLLYRIAVNRAQDVIALGWQKARQREVYPDPQYLAGLEAPEDVAELPPDDEKLTNDINVSLEALPELQRRILEADAVAGSKRVEDALLAKELDIPVGRVAVERLRGKRKFAERMRLLGHSFERQEVDDERS